MGRGGEREASPYWIYHRARPGLHFTGDIVMVMMMMMMTKMMTMVMMKMMVKMKGMMTMMKMMTMVKMKMMTQRLQQDDDEEESEMPVEEAESKNHCPPATTALDKVLS